MSTISTIAIIIAIIGLMYLAYKGFSIILIAPLLVVVAAIGCGDSFIYILGNLYLVKAAEYIKNYFPIFLFGAVFAKLMEKGGLAASIANKIVEVLGPKRAILAVILGCAVLTYGGLSVFVVAFVMYPFGAVLFRKAGIPKRLLPAALWIGIFTFTMVALPGTPQIQNIIPSTYFGTSTWSGIGIGLFATVLFLAIGLGWISYRVKKLAAQGEGYGTYKEEIHSVSDADLPKWGFSLVPLVMVIIINILFSNPFGWTFAKGWQVPSLWAVTIAVILSTLVAIIVGRKKIFEKNTETKSPLFLKTINESAISSGSAVFNVASGYAFGCVITSVVGFELISNMLLKLSANGNPLFSAVLSTNIMCGITGSASSGMTIALAKFATQWVQLAQSVNIPLEVLHRIIAISAVGIDPVPHSGALVTMFAICGLTHKESYFDIVMIMIMKFFVPFLCVAFYMLTGIV